MMFHTSCNISLSLPAFPEVFLKHHALGNMGNENWTCFTLKDEVDTEVRALKSECQNFTRQSESGCHISICPKSAPMY